MSDELDNVSFSARKIQAPIDSQIREINIRMDAQDKVLAKIDQTQTTILDRLTDIETDRKLIGVATVAAIFISSLALVMSIVAIIVAFIVR